MMQFFLMHTPIEKWDTHQPASEFRGNHSAAESPANPNFTLNPAKPLILLASVQNRSHNIILKRALIID
jgi:hypothetical protein